jgi:hypothetical protein
MWMLLSRSVDWVWVDLQQDHGNTSAPITRTRVEVEGIGLAHDVPQGRLEYLKVQI